MENDELEYWAKNNDEDAALEYAEQNTDEDAALEYFESQNTDTTVKSRRERAPSDVPERTLPTLTPTGEVTAPLAGAIETAVETAVVPTSGKGGKGKAVVPVVNPTNENPLQPTVEPIVDSGLTPHADSTKPPAGGVQ